MTFHLNCYAVNLLLSITFHIQLEFNAKQKHLHSSSQIFGPHQFIYVYVNDKFSKPDKSFSLSNLLSLLGRLLGFICTSSQLSVTDGGEVFERHKSMNFSLQCASQDIFTLMGHVLPTSLRFEKGKKKKFNYKLLSVCFMASVYSTKDRLAI